MATYTVKLPDVGEGVAEAEVVEWHVAVGDTVPRTTVLADVMTDKATVELPSPVDGVDPRLGAEIGDVVAVGSVLVTIELAGTEPTGAAEATAPRRRARPATGARRAEIANCSRIRHP